MRVGRHIDPADVALYTPAIAGRNNANAHHVTMRLVNDGGIARTGPALRRAARIILTFARGLFAFRVVATHLHLLLLGSRVAAGRTVQAVAVALGAGLGLEARFERARIRPILDLGHLLYSYRYVFRQEEHHGTFLDLAHDGSSLPEMLGLRAVERGAIVRRVKAHLPWIEAQDLRSWTDMEELSGFDPDPIHLVEAASGAFALPELKGRSSLVHVARRAAVHAVPHLRSLDVALLLGITQRAVTDLRSQRPAPHEIRAVEQQLRLRTALATRHGL